MKERGFGRGDQGGGRGTGPGGNAQANANPGGASRGRGIVGSVEAGAGVKSGAESIDALFAPLVIQEIPGRVWLYVDKQLKPVRVRTALSDGTFSEVVEGELKEGQEVVVNMVTGLEPRSQPGQQGTGNPLMGPQRGGPGPGGGGNRGGGGGGRGF
jgi:HlyD family secretion protein